MAEPLAPAARPARWRGQPLVFLLTVVGVWGAARVVYHWPGDQTHAQAEPTTAAAVSQPNPVKTPLVANRAIPIHAIVRSGSALRTGALATRRLPPIPLPIAVAQAQQRLWVEKLAAAPGGASDRPSPAAPLPDAPLMLAPYGPATALLPSGVPVTRPGLGRWSLYGWSFVRQGNGSGTLAPAAQYGGSQAGLLIQYALGDERHRPTLYARATSALSRSDDRALALGVSARPLSALPIDLAVERRLSLGTDQPDRFAMMAVAGGGAGLGRSGVRLEAYGQAGVVGLAKPLGFFDLQFLATKPVHQNDAAALALGGGLWAGGQQNPGDRGTRPWTHRVDIGPRAALTLPVERGSLVLALDWRQRVDGDARPASGAALTLSAGF